MPSNINFSSCVKCQKSTFEIVFLLYVAVEIRQLVNEISSFPEVLYKRRDLKNLLKSTDKHKKQWSGGVLSKDVHKNFADKHLCPSLFFNKVAGWKPETARRSHWRCFVKKVVFKKAQRCFRTSRSQILYKIGVLG